MTQRKVAQILIRLSPRTIRLRSHYSAPENDFVSMFDVRQILEEMVQETRGKRRGQPRETGRGPGRGAEC